MELKSAKWLVLLQLLKGIGAQQIRFVGVVRQRCSGLSLRAILRPAARLSVVSFMSTRSVVLRARRYASSEGDARVAFANVEVRLLNPPSSPLVSK